MFKKIRLFYSNVVASLRRAFLVDAMVETSYLDKPPHHVKLSFIEGVLLVYLRVYGCREQVEINSCNFMDEKIFRVCLPKFHLTPEVCFQKYKSFVSPGCNFFKTQSSLL